MGESGATPEIAVLLLLAIAAQGVFAGAMLTEACVLVPHWRSLGATGFFAHYDANARRLFRYFAPVTAVAALATFAATLAAFVSSAPGRGYLALGSLASIAYVAMFPLYFAGANASFIAASIPSDRLPAALARWAALHWLRTGIAFVALAAVLLARA